MYIDMATEMVIDGYVLVWEKHSKKQTQLDSEIGSSSRTQLKKTQIIIHILDSTRLEFRVLSQFEYCSRKTRIFSLISMHIF